MSNHIKPKLDLALLTQLVEVEWVPKNQFLKSVWVKALFSSIFFKTDTVAILFVFNKYCPIIG